MFGINIWSISMSFMSVCFSFKLDLFFNINFINFNSSNSQQQSRTAVPSANLLLINKRKLCSCPLWQFPGSQLVFKVSFHYSLVYTFLLGEKVFQHTANSFFQQFFSSSWIIKNSLLTKIFCIQDYVFFINLFFSFMQQNILPYHIFFSATKTTKLLSFSITC